jgi:F420-non-reducing hydrogenase iron-sulfur subunit
MSGGEGTLFAETMNDFGKAVKELGPLGKGEGMDEHVLKSKLAAASKLTNYLRLVERERLRLPFRSKEEFQQFFDSDEMKKLFEALIADKLAVSEITSLLSEGPLSTANISEMLGMTPSDVARHMNDSSKQGLVRFDEEHKRYFLA